MSERHRQLLSQILIDESGGDPRAANSLSKNQLRTTQERIIAEFGFPQEDPNKLTPNIDHIEPNSSQESQPDQL